MSRVELLLNEVQREADARFADLIALLLELITKQENLPYFVHVREQGYIVWFPRDVWNMMLSSMSLEEMHRRFGTVVVRG